MKQIRPKTIPDLLTKGQDAAKGAATIGPAIGLVRNTDVAINGKITALRTAVTNRNNGNTTLTNNRAVVRSVTLSGRDYLRVCREVLKENLGKKYSVAWDETGFVKSLRIPSAAVQLQPRLQSMQTFLAGHPDYQVEDVNATAAHGESLFNSLSTARTAVNDQRATVKTLLTARNTAERELRGILRGLFAELEQILGPLDPRWLQFGFNMPGLEQAPAVPENVVAVSHVAGRIEMNWPKVERAASFHIWERVVGPEREDFVLVGSPTDRQFTKSGLTSGTRMELCVSALNTGGESARSAIVVVNVA